MQQAMMACSHCLCPAGENSSPTGQRSFLHFNAISIRDLIKSKEPHISLSLRGMDRGNAVDELKLSGLQVEGECNSKTPPEDECPVLCDSVHASVHETENSPMMRAAVLCSQVSKLYRFKTEDQRWLLVREQMWETPLSFSLPKQLLSLLIREHTNRLQGVRELADVPSCWEALRCGIVNHCELLIGCYQETLSQLNRLSATSSFKSSSSKSDKHLQFVPTNLHCQRMEVSDTQSSGVWYDVITFGAPADHHQAFKHGGLGRVLSKHTNSTDSSSSFSPGESSRARKMLASIAQLQPLIFGLSEELLATSLDLNASRLEGALENLTQQTEVFVHALKDELIKKALMEIHMHCSSDGRVQTDGQPCNHQDGSTTLQDRGRTDMAYNEEEWDRAWANVAMSLNCIIVMSDRLLGREERPQQVTSSEQQEVKEDTNPQTSPSSPSAPSWQEQLLPLVVTLRDCVREAVGNAVPAMTYVILQEAAKATVSQGTVEIVHRRHAVFSQALSGIVCGVMLKLHSSLENQDFLQQLHSVGFLAQFEGLLSTYGDEMGMLEDMEVGVADLSDIMFTVTEVVTEEPEELLPKLSGAWGSLVVVVPLPPENFRLLPSELKEGCLIPLHPVLFNIGINQQQSLAERFGNSSLQERMNRRSCERLRVYCSKLVPQLPTPAGVPPLSDLLDSLEQSIQSRRKKNVEVLWTAAMVCRAVNGVRLTSCKSAKDRTAMSVTLEQCILLRERHTLGRQHFSTALDCMRRSRLSWGQIFGCYTHSGLTTCGAEPGDRGKWLPQCMALKAPRRHLYPVAFLLVSSHLLVLWLILSLVILLAKYQ
ncbi:type II inositol 3,4-bisphosphate 4-phosphatase-like isoform X3 [Nelusetta ayraudi]|uniref:type II inositol 3,4-bisphosphate 4-phosphatase-like isoform X3 n=1 Tax=Nelusetta ayraudi TaxID=303726 RepID=UPI003F71DA13